MDNQTPLTFRQRLMLAALSGAVTCTDHPLDAARQAWAIADAALFSEGEDSSDLWPYEVTSTTPLTLLSPEEVVDLLMSEPDDRHPANKAGVYDSLPTPPPALAPVSAPFPSFLTPAQRIAAEAERREVERQDRIAERALRSAPTTPFVGPRPPYITLQSALSLVATPVQGSEGEGEGA